MTRVVPLLLTGVILFGASADAQAAGAAPVVRALCAQVAAGSQAPKPVTQPSAVSLQRARELMRELAGVADEEAALRRKLESKGFRDDMSSEELDRWFAAQAMAGTRLARDRVDRTRRCCELAMRIWRETGHPCALARVPRRELSTRLAEVTRAFQGFLDSRRDGMTEEDVWQGIGETVDLVDSDYAGPALCVLSVWVECGPRSRQLPTHWEWSHIGPGSRTQIHARLLSWRGGARATCRFDRQWRTVVGPQGIGSAVVDINTNAWMLWPPLDDADRREAMEAWDVDGR